MDKRSKDKESLIASPVSLSLTYTSLFFLSLTHTHTLYLNIDEKINKEEVEKVLNTNKKDKMEKEEKEKEKKENLKNSKQKRTHNSPSLPPPAGTAARPACAPRRRPHRAERTSRG